jgi:peptidase A4-like protein
MKKYTIAMPVLMALALTSGLALVRASGMPASRPATRVQPLPRQDWHAADLLRTPRLRRGGSTATNWSGYAADGPNGTFTDVKGSWTIPLVDTTDSCSGSYSASWVGIDGDNSNTVEQCGTEQDGNGQYYAWYEMYPHVGYYVTFPGDGKVMPGDVITAEVQYIGRGSFKLTMASTNPLWKTAFKNGIFTTTQKLSSAQRSSAEWIMEAPWSGGVLPLANFGSINFTGCHSSPALTGVPPSITMVDSSYVPGDDLASHTKAAPGAWSWSSTSPATGSFSVTYVKCQ